MPLCLRRQGLMPLAALIAAACASPAFTQSQPATDQTQTQSQTPAQASPPAEQKTDGKGDKDSKPASKATTVKGVVVTADQPPVRTDIDRVSYDISKDLQAQNGASVADVLRNVPSVDVDLDGAVTLRGQSGVTIMIDGKPSPIFAGAGGGQALLQIPADQYERVEVMTNPSAAFSPEGSAGIINLVTKKHHPMGSFGSVRAAAAADDRYRGGVNSSIKNDKLTVVLNAGGNHDDRTQRGSGVSESFDPSGALLTSTSSRRETHFVSHATFGGADLTWDFDPKTQLAFSLSGYHGIGRPESISESVFSDSSGAVVQDIRQTADNAFDSQSIYGDLRFRRDFAGDDHNLTVDLSHGRQDRVTDQFFTDAFVTPVTPDTFQRSDQNNINNTTEFSGDYVGPAPAGGKLKAGWDVLQEDVLNTNAGFLGASSPSALDDPGQSDFFHFQRRVSAGYVTYQQPFGKFTVLAGLRLEDENLDIDDVTSKIVVKADDVHLYPTLDLAYAINDTQELRASYGERIQRPDSGELDPFLRVYGPFAEAQGNPFLKPEQTQDFEGSWHYRGGGQFYIATVYYKINTGGVTEITSDVGNGVYLTTPENLTKSQDAGLELVASSKLSHGVSYNVSGNIYWNEIDGSALGFTQTRSGTTVAGRGTINWQADPSDLMQATIAIRGRSLTPQGYSENRPAVNLGYSHKVNDRLRFVATVQDLFDTAGQKNVLESALLRGHSISEQHDRALYLGFSLSFGTGRQQQPDFEYGDSH